MKTQYFSKISGTGSAFPARRLTNFDLTKIVETSNEWILERTGIVERRIADRNNPEERNSSLASKAALSALEMAGKTAMDIDLIIYATCTPDTQVPATACYVQQKIGAKRAAAFDVNAACSGFVYAVSTADQYIRTGMYQTILVIGADMLTSITNWKDRNSCILFGDAAGALIMERAQEVTPENMLDKKQSRVMSTHLGSDGTLWELLDLPAGGSNLELTPELMEKQLNKLQMKGTEVFKIAVKTLSEYADKALKVHDITADQVDWVIPHQANLRIIEATARRLGVPMDKVICNVQRYGNTSSATVPTALDEAVRDGRIKPGQMIIFTVFGAGLTYGSALIRW